MHELTTLAVEYLQPGMKVIAPVRGSSGITLLTVTTIAKIEESEDTKEDTSEVFKTRTMRFVSGKHAVLRPKTEVVILALEEKD